MSSNATCQLYPEIEPYHSDWMKIPGSSHAVYFEQCGNPDGRPVIFLHGGPGSGCNPNQRRFFDPVHYRIILMDQRGCGRSTPLGETEDNTTSHLIADLEQLRLLLGIQRWLVFGGSWGSTLALTYAIAHPEAVAGLILRGIFLSRKNELDWFLGQSELFFPEAWQTLIDYLPPDERDNPLDAYARHIFAEDTTISAPAAARWNAYESSIMRLLPEADRSESVPDTVQIARARVQIHYIRNGCFVSHRDLLTEAGKLRHIPTVIVQGRYDMVCPPLTAWQLSQAMPHAELHMVADAGHSAMEAGTCAALRAATDRFRELSY
ncbi:MAG TPA: prolyl aminopeptidase [Methylophilaceae bacterium]|jgi:proline iminopeptidase